MQLSEHFSFEELTTVGPHIGIFNDPPQDLAGNLIKVAEKLEQARAIWNVPVRISYGYRSEALNEAAGGSTTSAHVDGLAADVIPQGLDLRAAWDALVADPAFMQDVDQLIIERGCIHIGLPVFQHHFIPRHELRLDEDINGRRAYPLFGVWTDNGVVKA
jgi:hypothetical protein